MNLQESSHAPRAANQVHMSEVSAMMLKVLCELAAQVATASQKQQTKARTAWAQTAHSPAQAMRERHPIQSKEAPDIT